MSRRAKGDRPAHRPAPEPLPAIPVRHPAFLVAILACAASLVLSASYRLYDTDLWTLLTTGRAIWQQGIPKTDLWAWPSFGDPQVMSSWLFRWRLWPLWDRGGEVGLFVWRWVVVLGTFAFLWMAARRMGARGVLALPILAWCGLAYRLRTDVRPEVVAGALFALSLWILETARTRGSGTRGPGSDSSPEASKDGAVGRTPRGTSRSPGPAPVAWRLFADPRVWLIPVAIAWVNVHISWYLLFALWALYLLDGRGGRPWALVGLALVASLINPWGARALWQPVEFALFWRNEPLFRTIAELQPIDWSAHLRDGLPLLLAAWAALAIRRWMRRGFDAVEILGGLAFVGAALSSQRFLGIAIAFLAPFLARDASEWAGESRWPLRDAARSPWARGLAAAAACLAIGVAEWTRPELPLGLTVEKRHLPAAACDFVAAHGIRGRSLNDLHLGGYLLWRFWPERERLPFMTTQPENSRKSDRDGYAAALVSESGWIALDALHRFDWVLLDRNPSPGERLLEFVAADSSFVPVFMDDAAMVFVRRLGPLAAVADSYAYRVVPADSEMRRRLIAQCERYPVLRAMAAIEFARQSSESPQNALSEQALGTLALMDGRPDQAKLHLERALAVRPTLTAARRLLEAASGGGR